MNREAIYAALFERLRALDGVLTSSRYLLHWDDVPAASRPALFVSQGDQAQLDQSPGIPPRWVLTASVYIYVNHNKTSPAGIALNPILDAIEQALTFDNIMKRTCTLGGLVEWCRVDGNIEVFEGFLGETGAAIVPIRMLAA